MRNLPSLLLTKLKKNKKAIFRRFLVYAIILAVLFPIVFVNRTTIYSTILSRYDSWTHWDDENGIPYTDYGYQAGTYVGEQITIRMVASAGISYYNQMIAGNATAGIYFNNTVDYVLRHKHTFDAVTENGTLTVTNWPYDFAIYDLPAGWISAMVDAMTLNLLALAYEEYGNSTYLEIFDQVINAFLTPTNLGGNLYILDDDTWWYPEIVVSNDLNPNYEIPLILIGFLFALVHLYQANVILNNTALEHVFDQGVISAAANLHKYDLTNYEWTLYHLAYPQKLASRGYHQIHINLTRQLYEFTNVTEFDVYSIKWETYTNRPFFTWEEIFSWEFIGNGLLLLTIIMVPVLSIDMSQTLVRKYLRKRIESES
ncbi:MAG: hypothetical protein E4H14_13270 [Candidatus Thorarchaeota archaeon]|nr:MAG: hypothetical protein E4H14_13270 [Candidatus Thorarchaeota archaeon]